jgi:hypothetical protein
MAPTSSAMVLRLHLKLITQFPGPPPPGSYTWNCSECSVVRRRRRTFRIAVKPSNSTSSKSTFANNHRPLKSCCRYSIRESSCWNVLLALWCGCFCRGQCEALGGSDCARIVICFAEHDDQIHVVTSQQYVQFNGRCTENCCPSTATLLSIRRVRSRHRSQLRLPFVTIGQ